MLGVGLCWKVKRRRLTYLCIYIYIITVCHWLIEFSSENRCTLSSVFIGFSYSRLQLAIVAGEAVSCLPKSRQFMARLLASHQILDYAGLVSEQLHCRLCGLMQLGNTVVYIVHVTVS